MRKTLFIGTLTALTALLVGATAPGALAQDSGVDQYLENPGTVPDSGGGGGGSGGGGGGSGGGGGGSGGGGGGYGGGSAPAPTGPSVGSAPAGTVEQPATSSGTTTTESADTGATSGDGKSAEDKDKKKKKRSADEKTKQEPADPVLSRAKGSAVQDSGSSGLGIALPIILGVLLLGAGVFAAVRLRRAKAGHA